MKIGQKRRVDDYSETYVQLGNLYVAYKKFDDARNAYIKAIELNSRNINAKKEMADLYEKLGDKDKAMKEWLGIRDVNYNDIHVGLYDVHREL